jgi:hypothetical protein
MRSGSNPLARLLDEPRAAAGCCDGFGLVITLTLDQESCQILGKFVGKCPPQRAQVGAIESKCATAERLALQKDRKS